MTLAIEAAVSSNSLPPLSSSSPGNAAQSAGGSFAATVVSMLESISPSAVGSVGNGTGAIGVLKAATNPGGGISGGGKSSTKNAGRTDPVLPVNPASLLSVPAIGVLTVDAFLPGIVPLILMPGIAPAVDKGPLDPASTSVVPQTFRGAPFGTLPGSNVQKIGPDPATPGVQPAKMMLNSAVQVQVSPDTSVGIMSAASASPSAAIASSINQQADAALAHVSVEPNFVSAVTKEVTATNLVPPSPAALLPASSQMDASSVDSNTISNAPVPWPTVGAGPAATESMTSGSMTGGPTISGVTSANAIQNNGGNSAAVQPPAAPADRSSAAGSNPDHVIAEIVAPQVLNSVATSTLQPALTRPPAQTSSSESSATQVNTNACLAESLLASTLSSSPTALTVSVDPQMASSPHEVTPPNTLYANEPAAGSFRLPVLVNPSLVSNSKVPQMDSHRVNNGEQNSNPLTAVPQSASSPNVSAPSQVSPASLAASKVTGVARLSSNSNPTSGVQTHDVGVAQPSAPSASVTALPGTAVVTTPTGLKPTSSTSPQPTMTHEVLDPPAVSVPGPVHMAQIINKLGQSEIHIGMNTSAFGNVEVHTVVHASDVGLMIGSEKGDLRSLLANEMPGIAHTMQQQNLRLNTVSFQQGFSPSSNSSGGGDSPPHCSHPAFRGAVNTEISVTNANDSVEPVPPGFSSTPGSLSILV